MSQDNVGVTTITRFLAVFACLMPLLTVPAVLHSQQYKQQLHKVSDVRLRGIADPPELAGAPPPAPPKPSAASMQFIQSKAIQQADPHDPKTLEPAFRELDELIHLEPNNSDLYLIRATLSCQTHTSPTKILEDIARSISLHQRSKSTDYPTLRERLAFKAKVEFEAGQLQESMADLDAAIREDYKDAENVFNDGKVEPTKTQDPCVWTEPDLDILEQKAPNDYRPALYRGLYLNVFLRFDLESDRRDVVTAFERSSALNPTTSLPHFFLGQLYVEGLGGMISMQNAKCLDWVKPRMEECIALDKIQRKGIRTLTRAIALDPTFAPAYEVRAGAFLKLKEYRQAIRDFDKTLELAPSGESARIAYNDRGIAKSETGQYQGAILDFTKAIAMGCESLCGSYDNRADAFLKLHNYPKAIEDISRSIEKTLSSYLVFSVNIDQFRRIYPEYDSVPDDVLCEKLRALFHPTMKYADFANQFLVQAKEFASTVVPDLYLKRGDAYAAMGQIAKANIEYDRALHGFPDYANSFFTEQNGKRIRKPD
jgi:tetratricopeptide (TPR) repeat protein